MKRVLTLLIVICTNWQISAQNASIEEAHGLLSEGYLEEALDMFNDLHADNANNAEFFFLRGSCLSELGENEKAITDFNVSISLEN